jgi:hypothetical protein
VGAGRSWKEMGVFESLGIENRYFVSDSWESGK